MDGSKVERIKRNSNYLRGQLAAELEAATPGFSSEQATLLKFHGSYQQENRDARQDRKASDEGKAYQFMVRSRIPGGVLSAEQYLAEDRLARTYGNGSLRITSRQGLQLHGVLKGDLKAAIQGVNTALLSTLAACGDVNRNVMTCPATGSLARLAHDLATHLAPRSCAYHEIFLDGERVDTVEEPIYGPTYLPRKFKMAIAAPRDNCVDLYSQDLGLAAHEEDDGYTIVVGGGMGMTHGKQETYPRVATPLCSVAAAEAVEVVETLIKIYRDYGDRVNRKHARIKYLIEEQGIAWFREQAEQRLGRTLAPPRVLRWDREDDHLGWHAEPDGRWSLGISVDSGRIQGDLAVALRGVVETFSPGVRLTPQQNLLLTDIASRDRAAVSNALVQHGVILDPLRLGLRRRALACPALPTCGLALADAERALEDILRQVDTELQVLGADGSELSIRVTGCPNGCARPYLGDIGIVGSSRLLYSLYLGGDTAGTRLNTLYATLVPLGEIGARLRPMLERWHFEREPGERFGDFCHRIFAREADLCTTL